MKINEKSLAYFISEVGNYDLFAYEVLESLIRHFGYSIKDIDSYDELTDDEKKIISKGVFNFLTTLE